jgi:hypothetical protein
MNNVLKTLGLNGAAGGVMEQSEPPTIEENYPDARVIGGSLTAKDTLRGILMVPAAGSDPPPPMAKMKTAKKGRQGAEESRCQRCNTMSPRRWLCSASRWRLSRSSWAHTRGFTRRSNRVRSA